MCQQPERISLSRISTSSSSATADNRPGPGRGLDKLLQYLGHRLECFLGGALDKFGYGPAAEERTALSAISELATDRMYRVEIVRGKMVVQLINKAEVTRIERRIKRSCQKLAKHLRFANHTPADIK